MDIVLFGILVVASVGVVRFYRIKRRNSDNTTEPHREDIEPNRVSHAPPSLSYVHAPASKKASALESLLSSKADRTEDLVTRSLRGLGHDYIVFPNLIIAKTGYIKTTEIDHVVISPYGIFCVETKSHVGSIYGAVSKKAWTQYLHGRAYNLYNPTFQNNNHAKAITRLLLGKIKAKVHGFVVFPNAEKVKVNSGLVFNSTKELIETIAIHRSVIYSRQEMSEIAYILAKYTHQYEQLRDKHAQNVHVYLAKS